MCKINYEPQLSLLCELGLLEPHSSQAFLRLRQKFLQSIWDSSVSHRMPAVKRKY